MSNSGEKLELKNAAGIIVDSIDATSGWPAGDNATKETMQKSESEWITALATPHAANERVMNQESGNKEVAPPRGGATSNSMIYEPKQFFAVDAGKDIKTVAGAEVRFQGSAYGLDGKLLDSTNGNARYLWNFGDGAFFEGKNTNHIYRYPGTYRAVLQVSSGQTSGSNVIEVMVGESNIAISEIAGALIELANKGTATVDMSSWQIYSDMNRYTIPARTMIGPGAFVVFSQETTGLLFGPVNPKAELRYANGTLADTLSFAGTLPQEKSVMRDEQGKGSIGNQTPGRENVSLFVIASDSAVRRSEAIQRLNSEIATSPSSHQTRLGAPRNDDQNNYSGQIATPLPDAARNDRRHEQQASLFSSNYFWLAVSISLGLLAGAVVLGWRSMIG
ncbi:MAG: lamin tail domain-containing protein [Candidatus Sungbacteria bacterium]|nr:lamin tail domain-containing protein [Candidatus Sungbacteria bacterium]